MTYSSHTVNHIITALPNERTMRIPIQLSNGTETVKTTALINGRATGNFIDVGFLCLLKFPLEKLPQPIITNNVDGTADTKGTIRWKAHANILLKERMEKLKLIVLSLGKRQVILGMPWVKKWNPTIDWRKNTVALPKHTLATETAFLPHLV